MRTLNTSSTTLSLPLHPSLLLAGPCPSSIKSRPFSSAVACVPRPYSPFSLFLSLFLPFFQSGSYRVDTWKQQQKQVQAPRGTSGFAGAAVQLTTRVTSRLTHPLHAGSPLPLVPSLPSSTATAAPADISGSRATSTLRTAMTSKKIYI